MELRHLRYFVAVAEELNFRRASEQLRVAQPALSTQIRDLEEEIGTRLFDRDTGGVRVTDAGAAFLTEARQILAQAQQAVVIARDAAKGQRGRITVGYIAPLLVGFMPASLKKFNERFPGVEVTLGEMPIAEQVAGLMDGTIQVGFMIKGVMPLPAGIELTEIARSKIGVIMGRSHRLAKTPRIAVTDLMREQLLSLMVKKGWTVHADIMRRTLTAHGFKPGLIKEIEGTETFRAMLESGMGVSLVAEIGSLSRSRDLVFRPLKDTGDDLIMVLYAMYREGGASRAALNFIAMLRELNGPKRVKAKTD